jgi:hypothetical protein
VTHSNLGDSAAVKELAAELRFIAQKRLPEVFLDPTEGDTERFPLVYQIVRTLEPSKWDEHPPGALSAVIRQAIGKLSDTTKPTHCKITWRRMAQILYGFVQLEPKQNGSRHNYDDYAAKAKEESGYLSDDFPRRTREVREALAAALVKLYEDYIARPRAVETQVSSSSVVSIDRRSHVEQISNLVAQGTRFVSIHGEPGTGKSTLAEMAAHDLASGKPVVTLHVANQQILSSEIIDALILDGAQPEPDEALRLGQFKRQLAGQTALGAVVIDDITEQTAHLVTVLVPDSPAIPVLLTSRLKLQGASLQSRKVTDVELEEFTEDEAFSFLARELPDSSEQERLELIAVLGRRPLMLFHASRFLTNAPSVSPTELAHVLTDNISENLGLIEPSLAQTPKLVDLYRLMLDRVAADNAAREVLSAFMAATGSAALCSSPFLAFAMRAIVPGGSVNVRLAAGLRELQRWGLLRRSDALKDGLWSMHSLTWRILGELRGEAQRLASVRFLQALADNEATRRDVELLAPRESFARFMYKNLRAATDLLPGWQWLFCMDVSTWISCRESVADGETAGTYVRYEILPMGVRRLDYLTSESNWVTDEEAKDLYSLASAYVLLVGVYDDDFMDDPDPPQYGLQRLHAYLEKNDPDAMRRIVDISQARPAFFYRNPEGFRQMVGEMLIRLRELGQGSSRH